MYKKLLVVFCYACLVCSGCSKSGNAENNSGEITENVFENTETDAAGAWTDADNGFINMVSAGIKDEKIDYEYDGQDVVLEYQYAADNADCVGLMVLVDGVPVEIAINGKEDKALFKRVPIVAGEDKNDIDISFTPIGNKGDTVSVEVIDITDPNADILSLDKEELISLITVGIRYQTYKISGINVYMACDGDFVKEDEIDYESEIIEISDAEMKELDNLDTVNSDYDIDGGRSSYVEVSKGDIINVKTKYYGSGGTEVISSYMVDGGLYPAFNGKKYQSCTVDDEHFTNITAQIDTSDMSEGRHIVFSVCGSPAYSSAKPSDVFVIEVQ